MFSTYIIWIFTINPNTVASGHSNPRKGNDLLTNNANYTKTVCNRYGDGDLEANGRPGGAAEKSMGKMFSLHTHSCHEQETREPRT